MEGIHDVKTNAELILEIGNRLRQYRLQQNLPVRELARLAGLSVPTVANMEKGRNPRLESVVRVLRALGRLDALDAFLPPPTVSPLQLAGLKGHVRLRARRSAGRGD